MKITDELRKWFEHAYTFSKGEEIVKTPYPWFGWKPDLERMLDRIDEAHKAAVDKAHADGERNGLQQARSASEDWQRGFDEGFAASDDWLAEHEDAMAEHGWIKLPVDADGVPIRIGDEMRADVEPLYSKHRVVGIELRESGRWSIDLLEYLSALRPECSHHHRAQTVEDVLNEMLDVYCSNDSRTPCQLVAEYAAKLQLKEVDE